MKVKINPGFNSKINSVLSSVFIPPEAPGAVHHSKHVYFCCKDRHFNMGLMGIDSL